MTKTFKHRGLEKFYSTGNTFGIQPSHARKLRMQLAALDTAKVVEDLNIPGYRLHLLRGQRKGFWSIVVSANWRLTFRFRDGNVYILSYEDYH
jgi:proteic killer suppression protein